MKHLITGGSGFLGNLIALRLRERGEEVRVLDIWKDPGQPTDIEYIECDIRDRHGVEKAMKGVNIVHHNVALVPLTKSGGKFWEVNVEGSRIAAESAAKAGVSTFVHMSSSAVFGSPNHCPITENTPKKPVEIYGRGKLAGEMAVRDVCASSGLPLVVIRPRTILGEGRLGIFQILFEWIRDDASIFVIGDGKNLFQFVHAHDLMDAYMLAIQSGRPGIYNVGTDRFGTLEQALAGVIRHAGSRSKVRHLPVAPTIATLRLADILCLSPLAPWHYLTYHKPFHFDVQPLSDLGWKPRYSNDEMFAESYSWFLENRQESRSYSHQSAHRRRVKEGILRLMKKRF